MPKHRPIDVTGKRIRVGDVVRVVGVPDLSTMAPTPRAESLRVFRYLVGRYKRVVAFDEQGLAELSFRIRSGRSRGDHTVWIEPHLLRVRRRQAPASAPRRSRGR